MGYNPAVIALLIGQVPDDVSYPQADFRGFDNSPLSTASGVPANFTGKVSEDVGLAHFVIDDAQNYSTLLVSRIADQAGQNIVTGYVPAQVFGSDSWVNPPIGLYFAGNTDVGATVIQSSGGNLVVVGGFSQTAIQTPWDGYASGRLSRAIAVGQPGAVANSVPAGGELTITFSPQEMVVLAHLVVVSSGLNDLTVRSIKVGSTERVMGGDMPATKFAADNPMNPDLSPEYVDEDGQRRLRPNPAVAANNIALTVTLYNTSGAPIPAFLAFTCK